MKTLKEQAKEFMKTHKSTLLHTKEMPENAFMAKKRQQAKEFVAKVGFPSKEFLEMLNQK